MSIFFRFSIFKRPEHKRFDPIPRFYDPDKEYIEGRLKKGLKKENDKIDSIKNNIRDNFRNNRAGFGISHHKRGLSTNSNIRLVIILVLLILITYYLLINYLPDIESLLK